MQNETLKVWAPYLWLVLFTVLQIPNLFYAGQANYFGTFWDGLQLQLFAATVLLIPFCILPLRIFIVFITPMLLLLPGAMLHIAILKQPVNVGSILSTLSGTPSEAWAIIKSYPGLMSASALTVVAAALSAALIAKARLDIPRRFKFAAAAFVTLAYAGLSLPLDAYNHSKSLFEEPRWTVQLVLGGRTSNGRGDLFPSGMLSRIGRVAVDSYRLKQWKDQRLAQSWQVTRSLANDEEELHVLVIGETSRRDHWQLYGYERETTPRMSKEEEEKSLIALTDIVSPANLTIYAVMQILSRARPQDINRAYQEPSIIHAYRQAGFKTYWLSNSEMIGKFSTPITMLADDADERMFTAGSHDEVMDSVLVDRLDQVLKSPEKKKFVILHMQGSHFDYRRRFTEAFNSFQPSYFGRDLGTWTDRKQKEELVNTYDNTLLYSDFILGEIAKRLKAAPGLATMTFVADHGELLMDKGNEVLHASVDGSREEMEVPFFVWLNAAYQRRFPENLKNLRANKDEAASSYILFDTLLGLGQISIAGHDARQNIFAKDFQASSREVLLPSGKVVDYDKDILSRENPYRAAESNSDKL